MIDLLVYLLIVCLIIGVAWWAFQQIPLPAPIRMVVVVVFAIVVIIFLLSLLPGAGLGFRR